VRFWSPRAVGHQNTTGAMPGPQLLLFLLLGWMTEASNMSYPFDKVSFIGRWWFEDNAMHSSWGTVAFEVTFQGSS
ncbi:unnamed protein product, partial [Symbiodinium pilosum]